MHLPTPGTGLGHCSLERHAYTLHRLCTLGQALLASRGDFVHFDQNVRALEALLLSRTARTLDPGWLIGQFAPAELALLQALYCAWEEELESRFTVEVRSSRAKTYQDYPLAARFERLIVRELGLLSGWHPSHVLLIGSGSMPITALCLRRWLKAPIHCVDHRPMAVEESRDLLQAMALSDAIHVIEGAGEHFDVSNYELIFLALPTRPRPAILENIAARGKHNVRIICRTSEGLRRFLYEAMPEHAIPAAFQTVRRAAAPVGDTISSCLLRRSLS